MSSLIVRSGLIAAIAALSLFTTSCAAETAGADSQPATSDNAESPAERADGSRADSTASFEAEELDGALVSSFPSDVPLYPGDVVNSLAALSEASERPEWNAQIVTGDSFDAVDASIRADYSSAGWKTRSEMDFMGGIQLIAGNDAYTVSITYNDFDGTGITINYGVSE
jgi:hypothetical protein